MSVTYLYLTRQEEISVVRALYINSIRRRRDARYIYASNMEIHLHPLNILWLIRLELFAVHPYHICTPEPLELRVFATIPSNQLPF